MPSDRELMELHAEALFTHDVDGDLVRVNERDGAEAPRFFLGLTSAGKVLRYRGDVPAGVRRALGAAADTALLRERAGDSAERTAEQLARFAAILAESAPVRHAEAGVAFAFPERPLAFLPAADGSVVRVTEENATLLYPLLPAWVPAVRPSPPLVACAAGGRAVAVCASVRITARAHEAGVETAPAFRGRGYAPAVVTAWAREVRAMGIEPLYSTSWQNAASQAVARKLGLRRFGTDLQIT
jgi:GNAT superfamily N-acetyltransferase